MDRPTIQQLAAVAPLIAGLGVLSYSQLKKRATNRRGLPLPPGPHPKPVIGNLLDLPTEKEWLTYHSWAKTYGDVVYVEALGQPIIILDSMQAVNDLLEKRSAIYSGRPESVMVHELMEFGWSMALNNGEKWAQQRKTFNPFLTRSAVNEFKDMQVHESRMFLKDMLVNPDYNQLTRQLFGSMMIKSCYGHKKDGYIKKAEEAMAILSSAVLPGSFLVDLMPWLKYVPSWFPGASFQKIAARGRKISAEALDEPMVDVRDNMSKGTAVPCFATRMLEEGVDEEIVRALMGVTFLAGADTTIAYLDSFMLAMIAHPKVQQRAREEIDRNVGSHRLPDFSDRPNLPYIEGILRETLRWMPVTPLGLPHLTTEEDQYKAHFIPKGTVVLANCWSILHDAEVYPEPEQFKPERWLKVVDGIPVLDESVRDSRTAGAFGFGRRICVGRHLAENSMWSVIVGLLATFDMTPGLDNNGNPITPVIEWNSGILSRPVPYLAVIKPRSAHHAELIRHAE